MELPPRRDVAAIELEEWMLSALSNGWAGAGCVASLRSREHALRWDAGPPRKEMRTRYYAATSPAETARQGMLLIMVGSLPGGHSSKWSSPLPYPSRWPPHDLARGPSAHTFWGAQSVLRPVVWEFPTDRLSESTKSWGMDAGAALLLLSFRADLRRARGSYLAHLATVFPR